MNSIKNDFSKSNMPSVSEKNGAEQNDKRDPKMLEAARGFEGQFIRQMISEMRKTVPKDELVGESMADDIFRGQLDDEYADMWVKQGGVGLADLIYDQMFEKYGPQATAARKQQAHADQHVQGLDASAGQKSSGHQVAGKQELKWIPVQQPQAPAENKPRDILSAADKQLFKLKMSPDGFDMKSKEPLPEAVKLRSPLPGIVLQAAALDDGRQMVVVKHDQGLVTQFVHTGNNHVKTNMRVAAGETIAELPASLNGENADVLFKLRKAANPE